MSETSPPRRRGLRRILVTLLVVAALAGAGLLWQARSSGQAAVNKDAPAPERVLELAAIELTRAAPRRLTETVRLSGSVDPVNWTVVKSEVAATLAEVLVREGQAVTRGDVLARFDTRDLAAKLAEKESNLVGARAQLVYAEKTRAKNLALRQKDIVAESSFDQAQSTWQFQQATVQALTAQVEMARKALNDAVVKAPIDGVVSERTVNPGETLAVNTKMFGIVDLGRVEVTATVPADDVARLKPGQTVLLRVEGFGEREFRGTLARINPQARPGTRAIPVYVSIDNTDGALRGGMFASGDAVVAEAGSAVALPPAALRRDDRGDFVLTVVDGRLARAPVRRGPSWARGELVQVEGLEPGALVVTAPLPGLQAGQAVRTAGV
ncbi:efflux RND transporter periplasmic adaptor subunit [Azospirillum sp. TSO22-1]|uniref:efflux RND transporter periplasmic adaptor subunit n=1 Tax=Azospirillum sp. TSO22-1 TaxID=716789 RepID=UPI000D60EE02|nr:efflux RND transporter periplasmic adaptor subunit [Azospirillum sp. TSO22-1]PWC42345.1 RND transporter [Azospirillum sp. TSO22-1]